MMASPATLTSENMLLAAFPAAEWVWARQSFKSVFMPLGDVLYEPPRLAHYIYFPTTSVLSVSYLMADGCADALTLVGREGFAGVECFLGNTSAPCRVLVLVEGWGYRIKRELLSQACARGGSMRGVLLRYALCYVTQVSQTIVCNRHHTINQQLCRWLLMFLDRQPSNELFLTYEHIAELMGVRRASVSEAAMDLQIAGCIRGRRGRISVVDRSGLEARSCECYRMARRETDRLLELSKSAKMAAARAAVDRARSGHSEPTIARAQRTFA